MEITRNMLKARFAEYNRLYFEGKLATPNFYFLMCKRPFGRCIPYKKNGKKVVEIWISKHIKTEDFLKNVLIHEMVHQYVYEVLHGCRYTIIQHGIRFHYIRWRLIRKYGLEI